MLAEAATSATCNIGEKKTYRGMQTVFNETPNEVYE